MDLETLELYVGKIYNSIKGSKFENIKQISEKYNKYLENVSTFNWILTNSGRQFTSSINPIMENEEEWYGVHYNSS